LSRSRRSGDGLNGKLWLEFIRNLILFLCLIIRVVGDIIRITRILFVIIRKLCDAVVIVQNVCRAFWSGLRR
jgi:hypothetical protein